MEILGCLSIKPGQLKKLIGLFKNSEEKKQVGSSIFTLTDNLKHID